MATHRMLQPTARQVRLGSILRRLREEGAQASQGTVACELGWSESKLSRIESGRLGIKDGDLRMLLDRYGVKDQGLRAYVVDLRRRGNVRSWETDIRSIVSATHSDFIGYESDASDTYNLATTLIPGLLQTYDYAAAVFSQHMPDMSEEVRYERLAIRSRRQRVFDRPNPLVFWSVLSESVFRHTVGGPDVMAGQLAHLLALAERYPGNVNIHVLPEASESHATLFGPFTVFSFPKQWESDIVYLEGFTGNQFLERREEVQAYASLFKRLMVSDSLDGTESLELIQSHLKNYRNG